MSTRTAPSMTQRGGGPSSPWQRPSSIDPVADRGIGDSRKESRTSSSRGYSVPTETNNYGRRPNFSPPSGRQGWGDSSHNSPSSYHRNDSSSNYNRDRERDQQYNGRNPNDYRPNEFERGHRPPARFNDDDRDRNANRGRGYENNRHASYDERRSIGESWNRNSNRGGNYHDSSRELSPYNSNANNNIHGREMMGSNHYDDRRRPIGRNEGSQGTRYHDARDHPRDSERTGNLGPRAHERELDFQRRQQLRSHSEMNDFRDYRHRKESDHYPSRCSTGRVGRNNGFEHGNIRRDEYDDRGEGPEYERPRQHERQWEAPLSASSREKDYYDNNNRNGISNHRTGMGERSREGAESHPSEWMRKHPDEARGYAMDCKSRSEWSDNHKNNNHGWGGTKQQKILSGGAVEHGRPEFAATPSEDKRSIGPRSSFSSGNNHENNARKRQREYNGEETNTTKATSKTNVGGNAPPAKSSVPIGDFIETNLKQESDENKKIKLYTATAANIGSSSVSSSNSSSVNREIESTTEDWKKATKSGTAAKDSSSSLIALSTVVAPSSETKIHDEANAKNIPVKSAPSLSAIRKHQIQAKHNLKPTNKLGIPMRWLKPKAKPKPPVKKVPPKVPEDTSKLTKIPLKQQSGTMKKLASRPMSPSNRLVVTDSSEGGSMVSSKNNNNSKANSSSSVYVKKQKGTSVPAAIVTKKKKQKVSKPKAKDTTANDPEEEPEDEWDSEAESEESDGDASESDTDDDEVLGWASKMLGVSTSPSSIPPTDSNDSIEPNNDENRGGGEASKAKSPKLKIRLSAALKLKLTQSIQSNSNNGLSEDDGNKLEAALKKLERRKKKRDKLKALSEKINDERPEFDHEKAKLEIEEERRKREEAKPLTAKELRKILRDDTLSGGGNQNNWVRRSRRQPNKNLLKSKPVRILVDKLKYNDVDMRVLKMKKYINDPNAPCAVIDAILNAMEENTNCEALYIQNFNEGMRDDQVVHLLRILQQPTCNIWCLNIGENYNVSDSTWERFTKGLIHTKITHMYASEHTITSDMKEEIRFTIRENRKKHDMHINPNNLDVIIQCTHCWWNPINAKVLRPFIKKKGYEHVLKDTEAQGLQGSKSMAPTS